MRQHNMPALSTCTWVVGMLSVLVGLIAAAITYPFRNLATGIAICIYVICYIIAVYHSPRHLLELFFPRSPR